MEGWFVKRGGGPTTTGLIIIFRDDTRNWITFLIPTDTPLRRPPSQQQHNRCSSDVITTSSVAHRKPRPPHRISENNYKI